MCDSILAGKGDTADGAAVFAKNSDREPNEGQFIKFIPAADHPRNSTVKCTYIEIPQVPHTHAVLLSKPYWIWGAEMGVNEHHVVIGNEAVFPKEPFQKHTKLIGMDLVRLGLERGSTAYRALGVITHLLDEFGQGGSCSTGAQYYYSSFLIADPDDAWVIETAGSRYAVKHVSESDSISNYLTIGRDFVPELSSPDLAEYAVSKGWAKSVSDFDFGAAYNDFLYTTLGRGRNRRAVTMGAMQACRGQLTVPDMIATLRRHEPDGGTGESWQPQNGFMFSMDVCMHGGFGIVRDSNTAGSLVVHLDKKNPTIFVTGTASPCTSIFKPVWMDTPLPAMGPAPADEYDPDSLFWRHELLHRATIQDFQRRMAVYAGKRDALEQEFVREAMALAGAPARERAQFSADCFARALAVEAEWYESVRKVPARPRGAWFYSYAWDKFNKDASMPTL